MVLSSDFEQAENLLQKGLKLTSICSKHKSTVNFFKSIWKYQLVVISCIIQWASWLSGNAVVFGAVGLKLKSRADQFGHSVANDSPPLPHFFERSCVARRRNDVEMGTANSLHTSAKYSEYNKRFDSILSLLMI